MKKTTQKPPLFIEKHLEIKTFEHKGVKVSVEIDFDIETISLIEWYPGGHEVIKFDNNQVFTNNKRYKAKNWIFVGRTLEYMNSWQNILDAMKYAITCASDELKMYIKTRDAYLAFMESLATHKKIQIISSMEIKDNSKNHIKVNKNKA